jgi:hypothetical protein
MRLSNTSSFELQTAAIGDGMDAIIWKWTADGSFTSCTAYPCFLLRAHTAAERSAGSGTLSRHFKYQFHVWLALRKRCWTADRLAHRGLLTHALCPLCASAGETMDHLSLQCPFAATVWTTASQRLGFSVPTPMAQSNMWL